MKNKLEIVQHLLEHENTEEARNVFLEIEQEETVEYWLLKGQIEQKFQNWGEAINAFQKVLEIDNGNNEASNNLHLIQNIINFWNPEMFNP